MILAIRVSKTEETTEKLSKWKKWYGPHNLPSPLLFPGIFCWCSFIPPETSVPQIREKWLLLGGYSLAGAQKFAFAGTCHQETDYALPKGDFHVPKGMATLDSGTVRLRLHGSSPFCSPRIVSDHKKEVYVVAVKPKLFRSSFRFPGKRIRGIESPWYIGQLPWEEESWGSKRPWYIWQFPWEDASCELNPVIHWTDFKTLGIKVK